MKLLILSDLHVEFAAFVPPPHAPDGVDAVILAGDILPSDKVLRWAARDSVFGSARPIIVVPGNHEYYGGVLQRRREQLKVAADAVGSNIHLLDPGELLLDGGKVRVLGCTLWTDFRVAVHTPAGEASDPRVAMDAARQHLTDYRAIRFHPPEAAQRNLVPNDTLALHEAERAWLQSRLLEPFDGTTVVVTHHGPAAASIAPQFADDWVTPAFVSDLPDEFFEVPALWVHGHTYTSFDYRRGSTRVVCHPRGYPLRSGGFENPAFDPGLVIEVAPPSAMSGS